MVEAQVAEVHLVVVVHLVAEEDKYYCYKNKK
jgi:hypothetical protein